MPRPLHRLDVLRRRWVGTRRAKLGAALGGASVVLGVITLMIVVQTSRDARGEARSRMALRSLVAPLASERSPRTPPPNAAPEVRRARAAAPRATTTPAPTGEAETVAVPSASIEGYVLDATGGVIAGARVVAKEQAHSSEIAAVDSMSDGRFVLHVKASGSVVLSAEAEGYSSAVARVQVPASEIRLLLVPSASLAGRVLDEAGHPIAGASVTAWNRSGIEEPAAQVVSEADGSFHLFALATGTYDVKVSAVGFVSAEQSVPLGVGDAIDDIVLKLSPASSLRGTVLVDGTPCGGASVLLEGASRAAASAGADGALALHALAPGDYELTVHCDVAPPLRERFTAVAGQASVRQWDLQGGLRITGVAQRASGEPLPHAQIVVQPVRASEEAADETETRDRGMARVCIADDDGRFECSGLLPDQYEVGLMDVGQDRTTRRVTLESAHVDGLVIVAAPSGTLRVAVPGAGRMTALPPIVATELQGARVFTATRDADRHVFRDLALGSYKVQLGSSQREAVNAVLERDGQVIDVELALPIAARLTGRVVDEHGQPAPDVWVRAHPAGEPAGVSGTSSSVLTDERGAFTVEAFAIGDLALSASSARGSGTLAPVSVGMGEFVVRLQSTGSER